MSNPDPAQVRRVAARLLENVLQEIDFRAIDHAIVDDLLNGEDADGPSLTASDVKSLHKAVAAAVGSAQVPIVSKGPFYGHAGRPYTLTPGQRKLPHGTVVSVAHGAISAGGDMVWEGAEAAFTAEVLYHCESGLTVIKTLDPRRHTRRYPGYTETVESFRLTPVQT